MSVTVLSSSASESRLEKCRQWLSRRTPAEEVLVIGCTVAAANELLRAVADEKGAAFGWHRVTLGQLAAALAESALVDANQVPISKLGADAVMARALHELAREGKLGRYERVSGGPGFSRAVARALRELRLALADSNNLAAADAELRVFFDAYANGLQRAGLADRASVLRIATESARDRDNQHPRLGLPTLFADVPIHAPAEREFVRAVIERAPEVLMTCPAGDTRTLENLGGKTGLEIEQIGAGGHETSLERLQAYLFEDRTTPPESALGEDVVVLSAPGENRECVEITRYLIQIARDGVPFDRMAILLRSPGEYRPHLVEALNRAGVPAYFARGVVEPHPAGRAFLALLACAAEGLSARSFSEYLSLGEVPDPAAEGAPGPLPSGSERWVAPDEELVPRAVAEALEEAVAPAEEETQVEDPETAAVAAGTLRAPRRWERLLVDAAVIGGRERWERRMNGLERELRADLEELDDPGEPAAEGIRRNLADLENLRAYALPLLDELVKLPEQAAWGEWLDQLSALAARALRHPERVLSVLAELAPMAAVGPVDLGEVRLVLERRLLELTAPPASDRHGSVFVAPIEAARGQSFEVVFVPGMAERLFPRKIAEEPILLDSVRRALACGLVTNEDRVAQERLALRIAVGAASSKVVLSYPRLELEKSRPRVPSFYTLEALRAAEGRLPDFGELASRAELATETRVGWPAPSDPKDAIDEAEHDLALLDSLLRLDPDKSVGTARYLLDANPHLGRALRFRARRWLRRWTVADGLVEPSEAARAALREHWLDARSYSPTALQNYAACPYKFFLYAVHRLGLWEKPEGIDEMDPLQRGSLVHDVQFELFGRLEKARLLPVGPGNLADARELLDEVLDEVAGRYYDELAPAIERVWTDSIAAIRADLREWLRRVSNDGSGFVPWRFELSFGLAQRRKRDPHSVAEPVDLDCGLTLRGSIDLVERDYDGRIRATDHKTGKDISKRGQIIAGGEALQPVLYALAVQKMLPDADVKSGRLYFCTSRGGFGEHTVRLDKNSRESAGFVAEVIGEALTKPFLPAAPAERKCEWCDYRLVCGPYEEQRTRRKPQQALEQLLKLRSLP